MTGLEKISFIGLGVMGYPMAGHLAEKSGAAVCVYNRTPEKAARWVEQYGGSSAATPAQAAKGADIVFVCVGNDDDLRQVLTGEEGVIHGIKKGAIVVDHTTVSAAIAREMHAVFAEAGCGFIDAPVSGGQVGAEKGQLTVMAGGNENHFLVVEQVIRNCFAKEIKLMGPPGSGQLTKMVNQMCIAGVLQGLSEGLAFALKAGLEADLVLEVIGKGAAQSWQMDNRGKTMVRDQFDFGFAVDWMVKDLEIAIAEAMQNGSRADMTRMVLDYYRELSAYGGGRLDTSSLIRRLTSSL